jgi:starch synthase
VLPQLSADQHGAVPIVRAIGGLVDTVFDRDYSGPPPEERNGYMYHHVDHHALESAMSRAIGLWDAYPGEFRQLMINGMQQDHSWASAGQHSFNIYEYIRHK